MLYERVHMPPLKTEKAILLCRSCEMRTEICLEIIAGNLSKAGWSWGCVSALDLEGRTIWIVDAHRNDGKRFVVHADEKLTAVCGIGKGDSRRT